MKAFNFSYRHFKKYYITEYLRNHWIDEFDDVNLISGNPKKYPEERYVREYVIMNQKRLYLALKIFNQQIIHDNPPPIKVLDVGGFPGMLLRLLKIIYEDDIELYAAGLLLPDKFKNHFREKYSVQFLEVNLDPFIHRDEWDKCSTIPSQFNYPDVFFDFIFATEIIEHLFTPDLLLSECSRVLRPRGKLWLTTNNIGTVGNVLRLATGRSSGLGMQIVSGNRSLWRPHVRLYTLRELAKICHDYGFKVEAGENYDDGYDKYVRRRIPQWLQSIYLSLQSILLPHLSPKLWLLVSKTLPNLRKEGHYE